MAVPCVSSITVVYRAVIVSARRWVRNCSSFVSPNRRRNAASWLNA